MTEPLRIRRPRRRTAAQGIPTDIAEWFAGRTSAIPMLADIYPDSALLVERWLAWKAAHPGAVPPAGFEWLAAKRSSALHPTKDQVARARKMLGGG